MLKYLLLSLLAAGAALGQPNLSNLSAAWTDNFNVFPESLAIDNDGNTYLLGGGGASGFTPTNPIYGSVASIVVIKLDPLGRLVWSTGFGGGTGYALAIDSAKNVYIAGVADGSSLPTTPGAFQTRLNNMHVAYAAKLNESGLLEWATLLGAEDTSSEAHAIAVDATGVFVAGDAFGPSFPTTPGAFQQTRKSVSGSPGFITKLNLTGSALVFSTLLGGSQTEEIKKIAIDNQGAVYALGTLVHAQGTSEPLDFPVTPGAYQATGCVFLTKINPAGSGLIYSTFVSRQAGPEPPLGCTTDGLSIDSAGNSYVAVSPHVLKINFDGTTLLYDRSLEDASVSDLASDSEGNAYVSGSTAAFSFPIPAPCFVSIDGVPAPGTEFILRLDASGAIADGGYLPSPFAQNPAGMIVRLDSGGNFYTLDEEAGGAVARKLIAGPRSSVPVSLRCVVNHGTSAKSAVAPGEVVDLLGNGIGPAQAATLQVTASGKVTALLGNTQVLFDGVPAPLLYAQSQQVNAVVPWGIAGRKKTEICVVYLGVLTNCVVVPVSEVAPGFLRMPDGFIATLNEDWSVNTPNNPAKYGSIVTLYVTGTGPAVPPESDGEVIQDVRPGARAVAVSFFRSVGGGALGVVVVEVPAEVILHCAAPALVSGVEVIQVRVPQGVEPTVILRMLSSTGESFEDSAPVYLMSD